MKPIIVAVLAILPFAALADDGAAPAATGKVPTADCQRPTLPPKIEPNPTQVRTFNRDYPKYKQCVTDYVAARQKDAKDYNALAQAHQDAANALIQEFNDFAKQARAAAPESDGN